MTPISGDQQIERTLRHTVDTAVAKLLSAGARDEALADYQDARQILKFFTKEAVMLPVGRVWRLGVLLMDADGGLYATGSTTRLEEPVRRGYQSISAENRRDFRAAAFRGRFSPNETVNFGWVVIDTSAQSLRSATGPLFITDGAVLVRWSPGVPDSASIPLDKYLEDRVSLLTDPPLGA